LVIGVASVGVDGVAGDPAGLLWSGKPTGDIASCRGHSGGPPRAPGNAISSASRMALPFY